MTHHDYDADGTINDEMADMQRCEHEAAATYNLFLDDERTPGEVDWIELPKVVWTIARNYRWFTDTITRCGLPAMVSFDHDLTDQHYLEAIKQFEARQVGSTYAVPYHAFKEKTGYACAKWLVEYCLDHGGLPLPKCFIHTRNTIGGDNIRNLLAAYSALKDIVE